MSEIERRIDTARELGLLSGQMATLTTKVDKMSAQIDRFEAIKNQVKGAKWLGRLIGGLVIGFLGFMWWVFTQLEKLFH